MSNEEIYNSLNEKEGLKLPSYIGIIPRSQEPIVFDAQNLEKLLRANKQFNVLNFEKSTEEGETNEQDSRLCFQTSIEYQDIEYHLSLSLCELKNISLESFSFANTIDEESLNIASSQPLYIETEMLFDEDPMTSFLFQLKVLNTLVPSASLVIDFSSMRLLSPYWLEMTVKSDTPPSPNYLYIIHAVYEGEHENDMQYWMHTHGLHRCGSMELELVNIKSGPNQMYDLINAAANQFVMEHFLENESFQIGYDGLGINLCWLRWEEALKEFPENILGSQKDRTEEDGSYNVHSEPSGILFALEEKNYVSPELYVSTLTDNPIYYIRTDETLRMSALATERFHMFQEIYDKYMPQEVARKSFLGKFFKKKGEEPQWSFLVKLGLAVDNAKDSTEKEHLWYEVQSIDGDDVTGKLLNEPYWINDLKKDDVKTYSLKHFLTDWIIYGPEESYTPDSIYKLFCVRE